MDDLILYGPPGTGKTTSGLSWLIKRVEEGADVERAAFVSYTNAAVNEATSRISSHFDIDADALPYSRTLHSLCYRMLGISERDWLADTHIHEFGEEKGYELKKWKKGARDDEDEEASSSLGSDAILLDIWDFARHRLLDDSRSAYNAFADYDPETAARVRFSKFDAFVSDYEAWKRSASLRDYTDLMTEVVESPRALPVSVAVIDEAQDLSPLMWRVADVIFADAEFRATLGDDDQAIYSFSGADPALMNARRAYRIVKLRKSYRLPSSISERALWTIQQNQNREPKEIEPTSESGSVARAMNLSELPLLNGESWFVLVRNWRLSKQVASSLELSGIPYRITGNRYSPWDERGPLRAMKALVKASRGERLTLDEMQAIAERTRSATKTTPGVWVHGAKKKLQEEATSRPTALVDWQEFAALGMTEWGFERVMSRNLEILAPKVSRRDLTAYDAALRRGTYDISPSVRVGTIHSVKGWEADNVALLLGCTGMSARACLDPVRCEEERRVTYVGVTRAKRRLYGLVPTPESGIYEWNLAGL